jgi:hypothetical protein
MATNAGQEMATNAGQQMATYALGLPSNSWQLIPWFLLNKRWQRMPYNSGQLKPWLY